jgi:hypothetical protein
MRLILLATVAVLVLCGSASATPLSYTFDHSSQGWQLSQDGQSYNPATFQLNRGNPPGSLTGRDTSTDSGCPGQPCSLLYFASPVVPALGANYGGTGSFDLRSSVNPDFGAELLLLATGDNYLDGFIPEANGTTFNRLSIALNETADWKTCPYAGGGCTAPSQAEFKNLIDASDQIAVMADVAPNSATNETYELDNVTLTDGAPIPAPAAPTPHKKKCKKKHRRDAKKSKKCKKKKHRRAAIVKLRG